MIVCQKLKQLCKFGFLCVVGCNFEIKANTGKIFSPGYGVVNYPGVLECFWSITSMNQRPVRLIFDQFDLENNDFVKVIAELF